MGNGQLWAGALGLLLRHRETGCRQSARQAICLLDRICDSAETDQDIRELCERESHRLKDRIGSPGHVLAL